MPWLSLGSQEEVTLDAVPKEPKVPKHQVDKYPFQTSVSLPSVRARPRSSCDVSMLCLQTAPEKNPTHSAFEEQFQL